MSTTPKTYQEALGPDHAWLQKTHVAAQENLKAAQITLASVQRLAGAMFLQTCRRLQGMGDEAAKSVPWNVLKHDDEHGWHVNLGDLGTAARELELLVDILGYPLEVSFNGTPMKASPGDSGEAILVRYGETRRIIQADLSFDGGS